MKVPRFLIFVAAVLVLAAGIGVAAGKILLIENQGGAAGFGTLAADLTAAGYEVTERNDELANGHANLLNANFLEGFTLVIYCERENTLLPANVAASLEAYIQAGGHLLVTGADTLGFSPNDLELGNLVRALNPADLFSSNPTWEVASIDHPIINGPFGDFRGQTFAATGYVDDTLNADTARGAIELASIGSPRVSGRIIFTDLPGVGGSVGYWNGGGSIFVNGNNISQPDFTDGAQPENVFRNYVAHVVGYPGLAGDDLLVSDSNSDGFITQELVGNIPPGFPGTITSWDWSWDGGIATGQVVEAAFPVTNDPVTVTLTVTTDGGLQVFDTFDLTALTQEDGLFTEFKGSAYVGISGAASDDRVFATIEGDTLVIDPQGTSSPPEVYRKVGGVWAVSPFSESVTDLRAVAPDTLVSGDFLAGTNFKLHTFSGSSWVTSVVSLSTPMFGHSRRFQFKVADGLFLNANDSAGTDGRAVLYDWAGTNWTANELVPDGGVQSGQRFGFTGAVDGDLAAVLNGSGPNDSLNLFERDGAAWAHIDSFAPDDGFSRFMTYAGIGGGVVVSQQDSFPKAPVVLENTGSGWVQTVLPLHPAVPDNLFYYGFHVDDDGGAFAAYDINGTHVVYEKDNPAADWSDVTQTVSQRRLLVKDLIASRDLVTTDFSDGQIAVCDAVKGIVRIFDRSAPFDTANAEPIADAGNDIQTTSFDGSPVMVFLSGGKSLELNYDDPLTAVWTWAGGSATGLQTFASIDPSVTSVELTVTDSKGAVSRDTVNIDIQAPPVVDPGPPMIVVDTDGDNIVRANVSATVLSSDSPVESYNWRWPGGTFSGSAGILQLGPDADGNSVILETIDANGLSSESEFTFSLLHPNPTPTILEAFDSSPEAEFGTEADINKDFALIGAIRDLSAGIHDNSANLGINTNGIWNQIPVNPPGEAGTAVQIDDDYAFVGAARMDGDGLPGKGRVFVLEKQGNGYVPVQSLVPLSATPGLFGWALARSGNRLLIGDIGLEATFVFELSGGTWTEAQRIDSPAGTGPSLDFGDKVAIHGDSLAIALPGGSVDSSVYLYEWNPTASQFAFDKQLFPDIPHTPIFRNQNTKEGDFFGNDIAMDAQNLIIGNTRHDEVYHYTRSGGNWNSTADGKLSGNQDFGRSVSLKDDVLVVGTNLYNVSGPPRTLGAATVFHLNGGVWTEVDQILGPDPGASLTSYNFGYDVNHDGRDLIVGAPTHRDASGFETGAVYIYRNYAALNPNANYEPIANAGDDLTVNDTLVRESGTDAIIEPFGSELVVLDASLSTDQENAIVSYEWSWPGGSASGLSPSVRFPVGFTTVTLTVTDDAGIVNSDTVDVTITLPQVIPTDLPSTGGNFFTVNLPTSSPMSKWRLSSEFLWHSSGETITGIVAGETYQIEVIGYPGSTEVITTLATPLAGNSVADFSLILPIPATKTGKLTFPETEAGFSWRLTGESVWRDVADNGDEFEDLIQTTLPIGDYLIEFRPLAGYVTPASRVITIRESVTLGLNWSDYGLVSNYDSNKTFEKLVGPDLEDDPYQYVGMIRTPLGRGTGTVVADAVVLSAAHLFFDPQGLNWANAQWFPRQQQGERQAPPMSPRGILYRTSYAKLIAPDSVPGTVENLPENIQESDFAVLYFDTATWTGGSANFLQSTPEKNWLIGSENKHAVGYPQRSQIYPERGMLFEKTFSTPLQALDSTGRLYDTTQLFGDAGASGSALFVEPAGTGKKYPAAILLAGQQRAVYRAIDLDVTRMIKDAADTAAGFGDILDSSSSLVTFEALPGFTTLSVSISPSSVQSAARYSLTPNYGAGFGNIASGQVIPFNPAWDSFTISFSAVSGYATPEPIVVPSSDITETGNYDYSVTYEPLSDYDLWKQANGISSDTDDRDFDGKVALVEYAVDGDLDAGGDNPPIRRPAVLSQSTNPEFEVYVRADASSIRYVVKASDSPTRTGGRTIADLTSADVTASGYVLVTDPEPFSAGGFRFAWMEYTHDRSLSAEP